MRIRQLFIALTLTLAGLVLPQVARADGPIYVDRDAPGPTHDGLSWTTAYVNVQDGLDAAIPGDELWVAEGVYTPTNTTGREATFQLVNGIPLYGGFGGYGTGETQRSQRDWDVYVTVFSGDLDGNDVTDPNGVVTDTANITGTNAYHVVTGSGTDDTAVLDGFTVTGGRADASYPHDQGGGMYNDSGDPTLNNVTFSGNLANDCGGGMCNNSGDPRLNNVTFSGNLANDSGGGMCNYSASPTLTNVTFSGNTNIEDGGGGMFNWDSNPTLTNVIFDGNQARDGYGGGMYNGDSNPTLTNVTFSGNIAGGGGGMENHDSNPTLTDVTFSGNYADYGGGMLNIASKPTLINTIFIGNHAIFGGGMYNDYGSPPRTTITFGANHADRGGRMDNYDVNPILINVTFSGNTADRGGGMYNWYNDPTLTNVTFSGNTADDGGGGMYNEYSNPTLSNCILWGNTAPDGPQIYDDGDSTPIVNYSLVDGGYSGAGNLNADPQFVDLDGADNIIGTRDDDLCLLPASPAVDAGDNTAVPIDTLDLDDDGVIAEPLPFDLDGNPRFVDMPFRPDTGNGSFPIVDMGACETSPSIWIAKAALPATPRPRGDPVTFTLTFANDTATVATGVVITDVVPAEVTGISVISSGVAITRIMGVSYAWTVQDLAPGAGGVITLIGVVNPSLVGPFDFVNTATITTTAVDTDTTNNTSSVQIHVFRIVYVDRDAPGVADGNSWANAYADLQHGLDTVTPGDEIWVAEGVYTPTSTAGRDATFQLVDGIPLYGGFGGYSTGETRRNQRDWDDHATVLSGDLDGNDVTDPDGVVTSTANIIGNNAYHVITGPGGVVTDTDNFDGNGVYPIGRGDAETIVLDGFIVTGGQADGIGPYHQGGGMYAYNDYLTLNNVTFSGNHARFGGGMFTNYYGALRLNKVTFSGNHARSGGGISNWSSDLTLIDVTFSGNHADRGGGGMDNWSGYSTLINVTFSGNHARFGGGMDNWSGYSTLINVTFSGNTASGYGYGYGGGGMANHASSPTLVNVTFSGNHAAYQGGGMYNSRSDPTLVNVTFSGNYAAYQGGGMYNWGYEYEYESNSMLSDVTFSGNHAVYQGGEMHNWGDGDQSDPVLRNCILWGNTAPDGSQIYDDDGTGISTINYSLVQGGWYSGDGNLDINPLFVDFDGADNIVGTLDDNLRLLSTSPAIDAGDNTLVPTDTLDLDGDGVIVEPFPFDLDGNPRFVDVLSQPDTGNGTPPIVDMGAYEVAPPVDLTVAKWASSDLAQAGAQLTYTIRIVNTGEVDLHATITDTLPFSVTLGGTSGGTLLPPGGTVALPGGRVGVTWTAVITTPGGFWTGTVVVTVAEGHDGPLTNLVEVTTGEGAAGKAWAVVNAREFYLPVVVRQ